MTQGVFDMIQLFAKNPALKIVFGPGSASHPNLRPDVLADVRTYVTGAVAGRRRPFQPAHHQPLRRHRRASATAPAASIPPR